MIFPNRSARFIMNKVLYLAVSVVLFGGLALTASAQTNTPPQAIPDDYGLEATARGAGLPVGEANPISIVATAVNTLLGFLGALLVMLVIYAGFLWMTAAGEEQKISKAKKLLGNAVIGLAIVLASYAIATFTINSLLEGTTGCQSSPPPGPCGSGQNWQCVNGSWSCQ